MAGVVLRIAFGLLVLMAVCRGQNGALPPAPNALPPGTNGGDQDGAPGITNGVVEEQGIESYLGDRCPFPPNDDGQWPDYCYDIIDENCDCLLDDIIMQKQWCIESYGVREYNAMVDQQLDMERERKEQRLALELPVGADMTSRIEACKEYV